MSAATTTALLCRLKPGSGSFPNQISLELRECAEQVEYEAAAGSCRVDVFGDGPEADALGFQFGDDLNQVLHRSAEPVELPHRECVALASIVDGLGQPRAIGFHTGCSVFKELLASGLSQSIELQSGILIGGGDPCVSD